MEQAVSLKKRLEKKKVWEQCIDDMQVVVAQLQREKARMLRYEAESIHGWEERCAEQRNLLCGLEAALHKQRDQHQLRMQAATEKYATTLPRASADNTASRAMLVRHEVQVLRQQVLRSIRSDALEILPH